MPGGEYNVWLEQLDGGDGESPDQGLARVFGIPLDRAQALIARLPRVVKHGATPEEARQVCDALRAIGGKVRIDRADAQLAPQSRQPSARPSRRPSKRPGAQRVSRRAAAPEPVPIPAPVAPESAPPQASADTLTLGTSDLSSSPPPPTQPPPVAVPASAPLPKMPSAHSSERVHIPTPVAPGPGLAGPALGVSAMAIPAPVAPDQVIPRLEHAESLDMALPAEHAAVGARHPLEVQRKSQSEQAGWGAVGMAGDASVALDRPVLSGVNALALPASEHPPPCAMRAPSERAPAPRPKAPVISQDRGGKRGSRASLLNPVQVFFEVFEEAERTSWRVALNGHPVVGFILVLGAATGCALLLYAAV